MFGLALAAQPEITLRGKVTDLTTGQPIPGALVVQKSVLRGTFTDGYGYFVIKAVKTDTIMVMLTGYKPKNLCYTDSVGTNFSLEIKLPQKVYALKPVTVRPLKTFAEIENDKSKLGSYTLPTMRTADALSSPITFLYERFSKYGRSRAKLADLKNLEQKKDLLKDLFRIYVKTDIMDLDESEFDDFIMFMNLSDDFVRNSSQYDLTHYILIKFDEYMIIRNTNKK